MLKSVSNLKDIKFHKSSNEFDMFQRQLKRQAFYYGWPDWCLDSNVEAPGVDEMSIKQRLHCKNAYTLIMTKTDGHDVGPLLESVPLGDARAAFSVVRNHFHRSTGRFARANAAKHLYGATMENTGVNVIEWTALVRRRAQVCQDLGRKLRDGDQVGVLLHGLLPEFSLIHSLLLHDDRTVKLTMTSACERLVEFARTKHLDEVTAFQVGGTCRSWNSELGCPWRSECKFNHVGQGKFMPAQLAKSRREEPMSRRRQSPKMTAKDKETVQSPTAGSKYRLGSQAHLDLKAAFKAGMDTATAAHDAAALEHKAVFKVGTDTAEAVTLDAVGLERSKSDESSKSFSPFVKFNMTAWVGWLLCAWMVVLFLIRDVHGQKEFLDGNAQVVRSSCDVLAPVVVVKPADDKDYFPYISGQQETKTTSTTVVPKAITNELGYSPSTVNTSILTQGCDYDDDKSTLNWLCQDEKFTSSRQGSTEHQTQVVELEMVKRFHEIVEKGQSNEHPGVQYVWLVSGNIGQQQHIWTQKTQQLLLWHQLFKRRLAVRRQRRQRQVRRHKSTRPLGSGRISKHCTGLRARGLIARPLRCGEVM